jgi:AcrR family transcriptional regulator
MVARSEGMASTRERIVEAALKLLLEQAYEDVTLVAIAEAAGVSHQTVLNHFTSKENVGAAAAEVLSRQTQDVRARAVPDDQLGAIAILVGEYERFGDPAARWAIASERLGSLAPLLDRARAGHQAWLDRIFADRLPKAAGHASSRHSRAACGHGRLRLEAPSPRPETVTCRHRADHARTDRRDP